MRKPGPILTRVSSFLRDSRGVATIEFAFIFVAFIMSVMGILEYSRALWVRSTLQHAADETAHYAMIHTGATEAQLIAYAKQEATALDAGGVAVTVTWDTSGGTNFVTIVTNYQVGLAVPFISNTLLTLTGRARVPQIS